MVLRNPTFHRPPMSHWPRFFRSCLLRCPVNSHFFFVRICQTDLCGPSPPRSGGSPRSKAPCKSPTPVATIMPSSIATRWPSRSPRPTFVATNRSMKTHRHSAQCLAKTTTAPVALAATLRSGVASRLRGRSAAPHTPITMSSSSMATEHPNRSPRDRCPLYNDGPSSAVRRCDSEKPFVLALPMFSAVYT